MNQAALNRRTLLTSGAALAFGAPAFAQPRPA